MELVLAQFGDLTRVAHIVLCSTHNFITQLYGYSCMKSRPTSFPKELKLKFLIYFFIIIF